jgi:hypothetical protein
MERAEAQKIIIAGVALGITAALVVWFLERFEADRLATELRRHLDEHSEEMKQWLNQPRKPS